jgi:hypothetical protein
VKPSQSQASAKSFWKCFGEGESYRPANSATLSAALPEAMRVIVAKRGFCSYREQAFWLCDPDEWRDAASPWFPDRPSVDVLGRSAFGELLVRDGDMFRYARVHQSVVLTLGGDADRLFAKTLTDPEFSLNADTPAAVKRARTAAGPLNPDEIYGYVPALALGGDTRSARIERVKAREHLAILAHLAPIQNW